MNRSKTSAAIALVLIITVAAIMASIPLSQAGTVIRIKNWAYVEPQPARVGVGQIVTLIYGIDHVNPAATIDGPFFTGFTLTITDPDGTVETRTNLPVDSTSFGYLTFTPGKVGTYYLKLNFAGQWVNLTAGFFSFIHGLITEDLDFYFEPATSVNTALTVQEEPVPGVETFPLPTDYWTTPIYSENKGWAAKLDNWLMPGYDQMPRFFNGLGAFSPYTTGPDSAHVLWTERIQEGGLASAKFGDKSFYPSEVYEQYYVPMILNGRIFYVDHGPSSSSSFGAANPADAFGTRVLDLYTGEELLYMANVTIDLIQTVDVEVPNKHGVVPYLWSIPGLSTYNPIGGAPPAAGLKWRMYDSWTGNYILTIENATGGFPVMGPKGEILIYTLDVAGRWMCRWNSTKCMYIPGSGSFSPSRGQVLDWQTGLEWNVTLNAPNAIGAPTIAAISLEDNRVLVMYGARLAYPLQTTYPDVLTDCAYPATIQAGAITVDPAWVKNRTDIYDFVEVHFNINEGMYSLFDDAELKVHTYDIANGNQLSVSEPLSERLYTVFAHTWMAYGNTYVWAYDGHVRCVDGKTGEVEWDSYLGELPFGQAYGNPPVYQGPTIADGKVYIGGSDHTPDSDMWTGSKMWCFDAFTGEGLWNITGFYGYSSLSNGYLTAYNGYNVKIYTFGKGPSATTVTASPKVSVHGSSVLIEGTVTDQSPGQKDTPAISDADMGDWMAYLHMQKPIPTDAKGVTVSLKVIDANNNFREIGTATTDISGSFGYTWTPDIPGQYTVIATFAGSDSYGSSQAETFFTVSEAPGETIAPTQPPASMADLYFLPVSAGMIIAIVAVLAMMILLFRKK